MTSGEWREIGPESGAIEIGIHVAGAGDFDAGDAFNFAESSGDFLSDEARRFLEALGELEADGRGGFAHFDLGRAFEDDIERLGVVLLDVARKGVAEAVCDGQVHGSSTGETNEYKWHRGAGSKGDEPGMQKGVPIPTPGCSAQRVRKALITQEI